MSKTMTQTKNLGKHACFILQLIGMFSSVRRDDLQRFDARLETATPGGLREHDAKIESLEKKKTSRLAITTLGLLGSSPTELAEFAQKMEKRLQRLIGKAARASDVPCTGRRPLRLQRDMEEERLEKLDAQSQ